jgi:ATP-binding cassette subfamily B protein
LSGRHWQKIALARTFIRAKEADLVILDESTSALGAEAEHRFFQQLKSLRKDKTTIFITHKYVMTATADCIHFMQGGKIVERGTHSELIAYKGEYARRYTLQTQGYTS